MNRLIEEGLSGAPLLTWLYCPASNPERMRKAVTYTTDGVIYDLEDAVAPSEKDRARQVLAEHLAAMDDATAALPHIQVRVNGIQSRWLSDDLAMLRGFSSVGSVRLPKVEHAAEAEAVARELGDGVGIHALIESAKGVENILSICSSPAVSSVSLGEADLRAQLRLTGTEVLDNIRIRLVIAAAAAEKPAPMGAAYLNVRDSAGLEADTRRLADLGFLGRTAVHPSQLPIIRSSFRPSEQAYLDALKILESVKHDESGSDMSSDPGASGASALADGTFIDRPVVLRARQIAQLWLSTSDD